MNNHALDPPIADISFKTKKYRCPVHGVIEHTISSTVPGHEGTWCQVCWIESLDAVGVHRVKPEREEPTIIGAG